MKLTDDVMKRMIRNEELVLSDEEQVSMSDSQWHTRSGLNLNVVFGNVGGAVKSR